MKLSNTCSYGIGKHGNQSSTEDYNLPVKKNNSESSNVSKKDLNKVCGQTTP